jgi:hypothetical protein
MTEPHTDDQDDADFDLFAAQLNLTHRAEPAADDDAEWEQYRALIFPNNQ